VKRLIAIAALGGAISLGGQLNRPVHANTLVANNILNRELRVDIQEHKLRLKEDHLLLSTIGGERLLKVHVR
jgi:hypothetical protein